jgi:hypothetical protein
MAKSLTEQEFKLIEKIVKISLSVGVIKIGKKLVQKRFHVFLI